MRLNSACAEKQLFYGAVTLIADSAFLHCSIEQLHKMADGNTRRMLEPFVVDYVKCFNAGHFDRMADFYHKNAVMVEKDKSVLWGKKEIVGSLLQMATDLGETRMEISNSKYDGDGDFLNIQTDFVFHTEKGGDLIGSFLQIWRRDGDVFTIYHDEYEM